MHVCFLQKLGNALFLKLWVEMYYVGSEPLSGETLSNEGCLGILLVSKL